MSEQTIHINIWDDYHDDGFVPAGEIQETYAYVEDGDLPDEEQREVLLKLQGAVSAAKESGSALECSICWHDSALVHPNLVGTEHAWCLYKRWQLELKHLPHREREALVDVLAKSVLLHNGLPCVIYSES